MPPTAPRNCNQARVDAIFQAAKEAQRDATQDALTEAYRGKPPGSDPSDEETAGSGSGETVSDIAKPEE